MSFILILPYLLLLGIILSHPLGKLSQFFLLVRLKLDRTVVAEYDIPEKLTPAELGYLVDRKFNDNELIATIIWLCQKGFVRLIKDKKDNPIVQLTDKKQGRDKLSYAEFAVLIWIEGETNKIHFQELTSSFSSQLGVKESFGNETYLQLAEKGYLQKYSYFSIMDNRKTNASKLSLSLLIVSAIYLMMNLETTSSLVGGYKTVNDNLSKFVILIGAIVLWPLLFIYFRLLQLIFNYSKGLHAKETKQLAKKWPEIAGYQLFLKTVEFSRMQADPNINDSALPYCIALGYSPDINRLVEPVK